MYCWNCGEKNPDGHRFCGQCGKVLLRPSEEGQSSTAGVISAALMPEKQTNPLIEESRLVRESVRVDPGPYEVARDGPAVNGRKLGQEGGHAPPLPASPHRPYSSSPRDDAHAGFRSGYGGPSVLGLGGSGADDLLLEEEDTSERSSGRRLVALLILVVLGILVWKQWSVIKSHAQEYIGKSNQPVAAEQPAAVTPPPTSVGQSESLDSSAAGRTPAERDLADAAAGKTDAVAGKTEDKVSKPEDDRAGEQQTAAKSPGPAEPIAEVAARREQQARMAAAKPQYDSSQVELAQRYLQGKGVPQDCGRGISLLRTAARQPNPKAQIQLGALYATGKCVTQDRAMAYRWFAQAQELEPDNSWINRNLNALWANMSSDERRRAEDGFDRQD